MRLWRGKLSFVEEIVAVRDDMGVKWREQLSRDFDGKVL
jgi:hypothetical protein